MRLWGLQHFFFLPIAKCSSSGKPKDQPDFFTILDQYGNVGDAFSTLPCSEGGTESSTAWNETGWQKNFIYPVKVCLTSFGERDEVVADCPAVSKSRILLTIDKPLNGDSTDVQSIPIDIGRLNAPNFEYCEIIDASTMAIAMRFQGRSVSETKIKVSAKIFNGSKFMTFLVHVGVSAYWMPEPGHFFATHGLCNWLHAVVCTFPGCVITAKLGKATKTEYFHIKENEAPLYEPNPSSLTEDLMSVTYFDCVESNCPGEVAASKPQLSNASYQLTEALVVTA